MYIHTPTRAIVQAFEPELDWGRFGVRVAQRDIPTLGEKLEAFTDVEVKEMQVRSRACVQACVCARALCSVC